MTGEQLKEALTRIAEDAPAVEVPRDVFARGRRATVRARLLIGATAFACVAVVAAIAVPTLRSDPAPVAGGGPALAVPDHLYAPPPYLDDLEADLRVGTAAAAFLTDAGIPVVVDADAGGYHLLDLPGITTTTGPGHGVGGRQLALSPDGKQLAWAWTGAPDAGRRPSGVRVVDLATGAVREIRLDGGTGVFVSELAWSPDSRWLAWIGAETRTWTDDAVALRKQVVGGVVADGESTSTRVAVAGQYATAVSTRRTTSYYADAPSAVAVSIDGTLAAVVGWSLYLDGTRSRLEQNEVLRVGSLWFDGPRVLGIEYQSGGADLPAVRVLPAGRTSPVSTVIARPRALGLVGPGRVLLYDDAPLDDNSPPPAVEIATWRGASATTRIIEVDEGVLRLSLAYQLIEPDQPTVHRRAPEWPWSTEHKVAAYGGGALVVALLAGGAWLIRRRLVRR